MLKITLRFLFFFLIGFNCPVLFAGDGRSDSLDILHYHIHLDITDISGNKIGGFTTLTCHPKISGIQTLNLDLLKLNIDSIKIGNNKLVYNYNDTLIGIQLGSTYGLSDTFEITVFYGGSPQKDLSNWGGFYFQLPYAYNLGVGFDADPHNYGRIWFPCFDNFVERSTYTFEIITSAGKTSYCNGELLSETSLSGDTILRFWEMRESIPTYLACVAVGPFEEVRWKYQGIQDTIPVLLAVKASDSSKLKASFIHLNDAMETFESAYGPYLFNKVGYSVVPFGSGAMEHASNITYPSNAVTGNTSGESLMAHELSHHWWGNLVTCRSQEDMWINEGWASYSAHLFLEHVYGKKRYTEEVKSNHLDVIQYAHLKEEKYRAVSGIPHEYTYGTHVYDKGASVANNLRAYMGDNKFFSAIRSFMNDHQFSDVNSAQLRDKLSLYSGVDLNDFFEDWVFGPGYPHVSIDSIDVSTAGGLYNIDLYVHQKKRGSEHFFNGMPLSVFIRDENFNEDVKQIVVSGEYSKIQIQSSVNPVFVCLNADDKVLMAVTADEKFVSSSGTYDFVNGKMKVEVGSVSDSFLLRVEHHWAHPDALKNTTVEYTLSDYRYWKVDGIFGSGLNVKATLQYDGRNLLSGGYGNLDIELTKNGSDSIILLYRKNAASDWWEYQYYTKVSFPGIPFGSMELDSLLPGEYVFANGFSAIGIKESSVPDRYFTLSPNPVKDNLKIRDESGDSSVKDVFIFASDGHLMARDTMLAETIFDVSAYAPATYLVYIRQGKNRIFTGKFVVTE